MKSLVPDTYLVSWQDWRHHAFGQKVPEVHKERVTGKKIADARKAELKAAGILCTVVPLVVSRKETRQSPVPPAGKEFNTGWKLHR